MISIDPGQPVRWHSLISGLCRCSFQGGYYDVDHLCCNSNIVVARYTADRIRLTPLLSDLHVVMLILWPSSSTTDQFASCFLLIVLF